MNQTIHSYFAKILQARDRALDESYTENQSLIATVNEFLVDLSIAVSFEPATLRTSSHRTDSDDLARTNDYLSAVIAQLHEHFAIDGSGDMTNVVQQINSLREKLDRQPEIIRQFEVL
jgi:hypothetical protein